MSRTSTVVWSVIGAVVAILGMLGLVYGPGLYRDGKALVGPIFDIAHSEERLAGLNTELPFEPPAAGDVDAGRFSVFLEIRRDLLPQYLEWQAIERELEQRGEEDWESSMDWDGAMEVLAAIRSIMTLQIETLQKHGMSPAEFVWIEDLVYQNWTESVEDAVEASAVTEALRESTVADLEALAALENRFGSSRASLEFSELLDQRLDSLDNPGPPAVEGLPDATSELFWEHREELADLDLASYSELHSILRGNNEVNIQIDGEGD